MIEIKRYKGVASKTLLALLVMGGCMLTPVQANTEKVWLTLDFAAFSQLQKLMPGVIASQSPMMAENNVVNVQKSLTGSVYLVEVEKSMLPRLGSTLHHALKHRGGYSVHNSRIEAEAILKGPSTLAALQRPSYTIDNQAVVQPLLAQMQDSNIAGTITDLSAYTNRYYAGSHGVSASNWLFRQWKRLANKRKDVTVKQFAHNDYPQKSVILTIKGTDNANEVVVLGGHLDSINHSNDVNENARAPGADDDASGIAGLTEVIRVLMDTNYKPRRTIKFIGYAAEEAGLLGSQDIAKKFKDDNIKVVGVLQLDMINYKGSSNDIYLFEGYSDRQQNTFVASLVSTYLPTLTVGYSRCGRCSDHVSWADQGYWASMPAEATMEEMNPYIHTTEDTYTSMGNQALHALKFSRLGLAFAVELGSDGPAKQSLELLPPL